MQFTTQRGHETGEGRPRPHERVSSAGGRDLWPEVRGRVHPGPSERWEARGTLVFDLRSQDRRNAAKKIVFIQICFLRFLLLLLLVNTRAGHLPIADIYLGKVVIHSFTVTLVNRGLNSKDDHDRDREPGHQHGVGGGRLVPQRRSADPGTWPRTGGHGLERPGSRICQGKEVTLLSSCSGTHDPQTTFTKLSPSEVSCLIEGASGATLHDF